MAAKIGDSVYVPRAYLKSPNTAHNTAKSICHSRWMASRREEGGIRIWKIAEPQGRQ